jgi:predicted outer membrane protein
MKTLIVSLALMVPLAALADDQKYNIEKKADAPKKDVDIKDKDKDKDRDIISTDLTQTQLSNKLHKVSMGHVEMGNLAQTHAASDKVKKLGEGMAKDFTKLDQAVIDYAKDHDIVLADALNMGREQTAAKPGGKVSEKDKKASDFDRLGKLSGSEFDKAFLTSTIEGCERFIPVLEGAKGKWDDKAFDRVLNRAIDTLKSAHKEAEKLRGEDITPAS